MTSSPLSDADVLDTLSAIVADVLDLPDLRLTATTTAADVDGWDSMAHVQIVVAVERAFKVRFRTGELAALADVGALVRAIRERATG